MPGQDPYAKAKQDLYAERTKELSSKALLWIAVALLTLAFLPSLIVVLATGNEGDISQFWIYVLAGFGVACIAGAWRALREIHRRGGRR